MKKTFAVILSICAFVLTSQANAEDGVLEFWDCDLQDGKTLDDAARVNGKWLKLQNAANPDAGIRSWGLSSIVGEPGNFGYMDAYPSLDAWAKGRAAMETPEGQALDAEFNDIAVCSSNRLYQATEH